MSPDAPYLASLSSYPCKKNKNSPSPIACLKVMEIYGMLQQNCIEEIRHSKYGYRGVVMDLYKIFLKEYTRDIHYPIGNKNNINKYLKFSRQKAKPLRRNPIRFARKPLGTPPKKIYGFNVDSDVSPIPCDVNVMI
jgi:hypothetical protein